MYCKNCGKEIGNNETVCPNCGYATAKPIPTDTSKDADYQNLHSAEPQQIIDTPVQTTQAPNSAVYYPPVKRKKQLNPALILSIITNVFEVITGFVSIIAGVITGFKSNPSAIVLPETYGGDAYTGIQNAAASTANNLYDLVNIMQNCFATLLIIIGFITIFYFISKAANVLIHKKKIKN